MYPPPTPAGLLKGSCIHEECVGGVFGGGGGKKRETAGFQGRGGEEKVLSNELEEMGGTRIEGIGRNCCGFNCHRSWGGKRGGGSTAAQCIGEKEIRNQEKKRISGTPGWGRGANSFVSSKKNRSHINRDKGGGEQY